jgi:hypothetical protein
MRSSSFSVSSLVKTSSKSVPLIELPLSALKQIDPILRIVWRRTECAAV